MFAKASEIHQEHNVVGCRGLGSGRGGSGVGKEWTSGSSRMAFPSTMDSMVDVAQDFRTFLFRIYGISYIPFSSSPVPPFPFPFFGP